MKKLSLFSILGIAGLLAFFATPIYAQEEETDLDETMFIATAEDVVEEAENVVEDVAADVEDIVEDVANETEAAADELSDWLDEAIIEGETDLDESGDLSNIFDATEEELVNTFESLNDNQKWVVALSWATWLLAGLWIASWIVGLIWIVLVIIALWRIFERAWEPGWKAIIPIYNAYILYKIVWMKNWFWYSLLVPFLLWLIAGFLPESSNMVGILWTIWTLFSIIVAIVATFKLPRKFGWNVFTSILYVLFTSICVLVLWFWNYKFEWKSETVVEA